MRGLRDGRAVPWPCAARTEVRGAGPPKRRRASARRHQPRFSQEYMLVGAPRPRSGPAASPIVAHRHGAGPQGEKDGALGGPQARRFAPACGGSALAQSGPEQRAALLPRRRQVRPPRQDQRAKRACAAARPARDLWRRLPPPVCAPFGRAPSFWRCSFWPGSFWPHPFSGLSPPMTLPAGRLAANGCACSAM